MIYLISGSRDAPKEEVWAILNKHFAPEHRGNHDVRLMHGSAPGADQFSAAWAQWHKIYAIALPALWDTLGHAAGPQRNAELLRDAIDLATIRRQPLTLIAMPGPQSRGTWDMVRRFNDAAGIWGGPSMTIIREDVTR